MAVILPEVLLSLLLKKSDYTQRPMGTITEGWPFPLRIFSGQGEGLF